MKKAKIEEDKEKERNSFRCLAMFTTLELQPEVREVVDTIVERLKTLSRKSDRQFMSVDVRLDMLDNKERRRKYRAVELLIVGISIPKTKICCDLAYYNDIERISRVIDSVFLHSHSSTLTVAQIRRLDILVVFVPVVDVVRTDRTDCHLEFYEGTKNLARMSDILAVYAWVDPATGYCQGLSDLLSPFIMLFEDNADVFWCFEMLLRRMRENFQMERTTGVMYHLENIDWEMFSHLSEIGAPFCLPDASSTSPP